MRWHILQLRPPIHPAAGAAIAIDTGMMPMPGRCPLLLLTLLLTLLLRLLCLLAAGYSRAGL